MTEKHKTLGVLAAVFILACIGYWYISQMEFERTCKPVVPVIVVQLENPEERGNSKQLLLRFDDRTGSDPLTEESFSRQSRITSCDIRGDQCVGKRARFERLFAEERKQSIQIRLLDKQGNRTVGGVVWDKPAYPDRVVMSCDLAEPNQKNACKLLRTDDDYYSEPDSRIIESPHDQCSPR